MAASSPWTERVYMGNIFASSTWVWPQKSAWAGMGSGLSQTR